MLENLGSILIQLVSQKFLSQLSETTVLALFLDYCMVNLPATEERSYESVLTKPSLFRVQMHFIKPELGIGFLIILASYPTNVVAEQVLTSLESCLTYLTPGDLDLLDFFLLSLSIAIRIALSCFRFLSALRRC